MTQVTNQTALINTTLNHNPLAISINNSSVAIAVNRHPITIEISGDILQSTGESLPDIAYLYGVADETVGQFRVCRVSSTNKIYVATSGMTPEDSYGIRGISINSGNIGTVIQVQTNKIIYNPLWNFIPNLPVYMGEVGELTQTIPQSGISIEIGQALTTYTMLIDIEEPIYLGE